MSAREATSEAPPEAPVVWREGVHVAGTVLWCDAPRARGLCFVSHAGVRLRGAPKKLLATPRTQALLPPSERPAEAEWLVTPFGRPFSLGATRIELFPSGRMPGAAQLVITTAAGGRRVIYAGEVNPSLPGEPEAPRLAEPCEVRGGDALVVAAPVAALGRPLPPRVEAIAQLRAEVARALDDKRVAVVLAPTPGGAEEALALLADLAGPANAFAHPRIAAHVEAYRKAGLQMPPLARRASAARLVLWPFDLRSAPSLARQLAGRAARRIAATGLALDPDAAARLGVDAAVPLSDHADLDALLAWVRATSARAVWLTAGHTPRLVEALARAGVRAQALGPPRQLDLFAAKI